MQSAMVSLLPGQARKKKEEHEAMLEAHVPVPCSMLVACLSLLLAFNNMVPGSNKNCSGQLLDTCHCP